MTKEDALLYFPFEEGDDIDDLYDQLLFEQKQFLASQVPISKVVNSRINRLEKIEDAYIFFGGVIENNSNQSIELPNYETDSIEVNYNRFQHNKNTLKLSLFNAMNTSEVEHVVKLKFENYFAFAEKWPRIEPSLRRPIISKEPDAMEIIEEIKNLKSKGIVNFSELLQLDEDNVLVQEAIRLSLWMNLEKNV
jgi:hypothetical protein